MLPRALGTRGPEGEGDPGVPADEGEAGLGRGGLHHPHGQRVVVPRGDAVTPRIPDNIYNHTNWIH